ncbi:uncharacterized protein [Leuresthes tenuis]|uniref:uncharacterized protein n=1 Tax=Leuresthes tenuis TaxID=355514 RepID=UPI003B503CB0
MSWQQYEWAEDDFLPPGVSRLIAPKPDDNRFYVMYHGTTRANAQSIKTSGFHQSSAGMLGPGVYLSRDLDKASRYPIGHPEHDRVVIQVKVNVGKVIAINRQDHPLQKTWHYHGYDTAWVPPNCGMVPSGQEENCVWDPSRITILQLIKPKPVQPTFYARGYMNTDTNMSSQHVEWAEDDFLPPGVSRLINNQTYVMYHGTTQANASAIMNSGFQQSSAGMLGPGVYLSRDLGAASRYPIDHPEHDRVVIKVKVNVGKVIAINRQCHPLQTTWHDQGCDTAWVREQICVWDPRRITILKRIDPNPVRSSGREPPTPSKVPESRGNTDTNMSRQQYKWAEDDFLPPGVSRLIAPKPDDNQTYVMYHGTTRANARSIETSGFRRSSAGMLGPGVYLSRDLDKASRYPIGHPGHDRVVIKVKVNVGKVIAINRQDHPLRKTWHDQGYDTAWVPPNCGMVKSGLEEDCVWDPSRITILDFLPPGVSRLIAPKPDDNRFYVMYHGTTRANAQSIKTSGFHQSSDGMLGPGVYLSRDLDKASRYPIDHPEHDRVVVQVKVNVGRVIAINRQRHPLQKTWHYHGYDTAWVPPNCGMVPSGLEENCVWDPSRITILQLIKPKPVQPTFYARGYM